MRERAVPNMQRLQAAFRGAGIEVIYTVIQNLTRDGEDRSLDYKISDLDVPKAPGRQRCWTRSRPGTTRSSYPRPPLPCLSPRTSTTFCAISACVRLSWPELTDQCVDSAVRDACDLGYLVTVVTDACATHSQERHDWSLRNNAGYARQRTTEQMLAEVVAETARHGRDDDEWR